MAVIIYNDVSEQERPTFGEILTELRSMNGDGEFVIVAFSCYVANIYLQK